MPFCSNCGASVAEVALFCPHCGGKQSPSSISAQSSAAARKCPFCKQGVEPQASRCPHCSGEIGRLQDCLRCPRCSEMIVPMRMAATDEKGLGTDLAKLAVGGRYFLAATEETYVACPACKTAISYCTRCNTVTVSDLTRKWVGVGRSKSGYQFKVSCSQCSGKVEGPSCFVATEVFGRTLDANLLQLYHFRDGYLKRFRVGRSFIGMYYRHGPHLARWCRKRPRVLLLARKVITLIIRLSHYILPPQPGLPSASEGPTFSQFSLSERALPLYKHHGHNQSTHKSPEGLAS